MARKERGLPFWTASDLAIGYAAALLIMGVALLLAWLSRAVFHSDAIASCVLIAGVVAWLALTVVQALRRHRRYRETHPLPGRPPGRHFR